MFSSSVSQVLFLSALVAIKREHYNCCTILAERRMYAITMLDIYHGSFIKLHYGDWKSGMDVLDLAQLPEASPPPKLHHLLLLSSHLLVNTVVQKLLFPDVNLVRAYKIAVHHSC